MKERFRQLLHATTKKNKLPLRIFFSAFGVLMMGFGMSVIEKLGAGTDPFTCMNNGLSSVTHFSIGTVNLLVSVVLFAAVIFLDISGLGLGTLFNMVGFGYTIDLFRIIWKEVGFTGIEHPVLRYIALFGMLILFILAVSLYLAADLGSAPYDALPVILADKTRIRFVFVRMAWDATAVLIGFLLGSEVGITTLVCALLVGPAAALVRRAVDKLLSK